MPTVFLSYSREDLPLVEQLEAQLKKHPDISIWRDQDKIYGGQKWPKVLGEAIADQDIFLLAWSKNSAASHFVEFEWCTAIALKKTIVPCLLDDTPLPPSLRATHGVPVTETSTITAALTGTDISTDTGRRTQVIRKLSDISATEETAVLAQAKAVFAQQQWTVQGNVYQAGGDIHIHNEPATGRTPEKAKPLVEKWQAWAGLAVAILTAVTLILDLPAKWGGSTPSVPLEQPLAGMVLDEATGEPLSGVVVSLPDFDMRRTTEADGAFRFRVTSQKQASIKFTAQKTGYRSYSNYATLGNTDLRFPMEKGE